MKWRHMRPPDDPVNLKPCQWARWLLRGGDFVVFDSETTGLGDDDVFVSLAVVEGSSGAVLFDSLINPGRPIPPDATWIHGITDDMVKDAPTFADVFPQVRRALIDRRWVIYNADFDTRILRQDCARYGLLYPTPAQFRYVWQPTSQYAPRVYGERDDVWCVMLKYANHYGAWSDWHGGWKWQKLVDACDREKIDTGEAHHALNDTRAALKLVQKLAWKEDRKDNDHDHDNQDDTEE